MVFERCNALTTPVDTEFSRPNGLPSAMTHSPTCKSDELPISTGVKSSASTLITAMSLEESLPTTSASYSTPFTVALMASAPSTTWLFVMMYPSFEITTPLPSDVLVSVESSLVPGISKPYIELEDELLV